MNVRTAGMEYVIFQGVDDQRNSMGKLNMGISNGSPLAYASHLKPKCQVGKLNHSTKMSTHMTLSAVASDAYLTLLQPYVRDPADQTGIKVNGASST